MSQETLLTNSSIWQPEATYEMGDGILGVVVNSPERTQISRVRIEMEPYAAFKPHMHPHPHLLLVLSGNGVFEKLEGVTELEPGAQADTLPWERHILRAGKLGLVVLSENTPPIAIDDPHRIIEVASLVPTEDDVYQT